MNKLRMQQISPLALQQKLTDGEDIQLVDVREAHEHEAFHIGGTLVPLSELLQKHFTIAQNKPVVVYCKMGIRSQIAIQRLEEKFGYTHLINLQGGLEAWKKEVSAIK